MVTKKIWGPQPKESDRAFRMFEAYCKMPPEQRSGAEAYGQITGRSQVERLPGYVSNWIVTHQWVARAKAYDDFQHLQRIEAEEKAMAKERRLWADRKAKQAAATWERAERLQKTADDLRKLPTVQKIVKKEITAFDRAGNEITIEQTIILQPIRSTVKDIAVFETEADKLQRLSTGSATEHIMTTTPEAERERQIEKARQALRDWMRGQPEDDIAVVVRECALHFDLEPELFYDPKEFDKNVQ